MNSLEIINREFDGFDDALTDLEKNFSLELEINYYELKQIKQDLEVLEIIKNKEVDIKGIKLSYQGYLEGVFETLEIALQSYNTNIKRENQLTISEFEKLLIWLEGK